MAQARVSQHIVTELSLLLLLFFFFVWDRLSADQRHYYQQFDDSVKPSSTDLRYQVN